MFDQTDRQTDRQTVSSVLYQVTDVSTVMEKVFFNETVNYEPLESLVHFLIFLNSSEPVVFLISEHDIFSPNGTITTISTKTNKILLSAIVQRTPFLW